MNPRAPSIENRLLSPDEDLDGTNVDVMNDLPRNKMDDNVPDVETSSEQTLRASERSYRRLFETAKDGILILDADTGRITDVNPFLFNLLACSELGLNPQMNTTFDWLEADDRESFRRKSA